MQPFVKKKNGAPVIPTSKKKTHWFSTDFVLFSSAPVMRPSFKKKSLPARPRHAEFGKKITKKNPSRRAPVMLNLVKNHHFWGALVMRTSVKKKHSISVEIPHYQRPRHANLR
jgi:hypothetical protein